MISSDLSFPRKRESKDVRIKKIILLEILKDWARKDLNLGPMDYESTALPLSYGPEKLFKPTNITIKIPSLQGKFAGVYTANHKDL